MNSQKYSVIQDGLVYIDHGPITMTLEARRRGRPFTEGAVAGAEKVLEVFGEFAVYLDYLRRPVAAIASLPESAPRAVRKMTESVMMLGEDDFTPLAAVAGTTADFAVEAMAACGADYALANNGGDIAWRISPEQCAPSSVHPDEHLKFSQEADLRTRSPRDFLKVGLISDINNGRATHSLKIRSFSEITGLATSGMGGRSLTRGIASAVTALASDSSKADAAATAIANACFCDDPAIEQCRAEELDYGTDISGLLVTKSVGRLRSGSAELALSAGAKRAEELISKGMVLGAVIFVAGAMQVVKTKERGDLFEVAALV